MDPDILKTRAAAIYAVDAKAPRRRSHENRDVQKLYETELGAPNSPAAQALLHTAYAARRSERGLLLRFLDCVDRRDAKGASNLFHPGGVWQTASPHGDISGRAAIEDVIANRLKPRGYGTSYVRHRMENAAEPKDMTVFTPGGERCRFKIEAAEIDEDGRLKTVIKRLVREVLPA